MRAVKLESVVPKDRQLSLTVPPEIPAGPVEIVILAKEDAAAQGASLLKFLDALRLEPASSRSAEAMESAVAAERNAWDE